MKLSAVAAGALALASSAYSTEASSSLTARADETCKFILVEEGDSCDSIARDRCQISFDDFISFNGGSDGFCGSIIARDPLCCTQGPKPDLTPQPDEDGYCAVHVVQDNGELCHDIAVANYLEDPDMEDFNENTWGWKGCGNIQAGMRICISEGYPPMPAPLDKAICGPQVEGTEQPTDGTDLADLNPCPLNVCCNEWGQCGTTEDFCLEEGGAYKCISNCGMDIVNNDDPPEEFSRIAYFEAWNHDRPCLHMDVTDIGDPFTHVHFAFGNISNDFVPSDEGTEDQFAKFKKLEGKKRIISFGGWAFSNEPGSSHIIREGVKSENRQKFSDNIVKFVVDNGLDGVDFDWEYPGADDIPGSEPGGPEDGGNYLEFLKLVREGLPDDKTLAIAAPASYWYLRNFPIDEIADVVSYIVYMTYDLHGQWDVGNEFVSPGCPGGNCLRSHVNITETNNALAMVTKAGVPANKLMIGVSSYGRSFKMAQEGCTGFMCEYLGERNESPAKHGECTETGGYIADAEIAKLIEDGRGEETYDEESDSNILVYDKVEWVAYMGKDVKEKRMDRYKGLNFAGVSDWAVDLQKDYGDSDDDGEVVYVDKEVYDTPEMDCEPPCTMVLPPSTLAATTTISIPPYTTSIDVGGDSTTTITITPEPITTIVVSFYNVPIPSNAENMTVQPYPSITVKPETITLTMFSNGETITTTDELILPPWPRITEGPPESWDNSSDPTVFPPGSFPPVSLPTLPSPGPPPPPPGPPVTFTDWDDIPGKIKPVGDDPDDNPDPEDDEQYTEMPCDLWFFNTCIDDLHIKKWRWTLPPNIILPPGPPPPEMIPWPDEWTIGPPGPLPWPRLTIGPDGAPSPLPPKPDPCEPETASVCSTTTSYGVDDSGETPVTTTSTVIKTCHEIYGCHVTDWDETSTTSSATCLPSGVDDELAIMGRMERGLLPHNVAAFPTDAPVPDVALSLGMGLGDYAEEEVEEVRIKPRGWIVSRAYQDYTWAWRNDVKVYKDWRCRRRNVIVYCQDPYNCDKVQERLSKLSTESRIVKVGIDSINFIAFWWVENLPTKLINKFKGMSQCGDVWIPFMSSWDTDNPNNPGSNGRIAGSGYEYDEEEPLIPEDSAFLDTDFIDEIISPKKLLKRADTSNSMKAEGWGLSQVSVPKEVTDWATNPDYSDGDQHTYYFHESLGEGQYVYVIDTCMDWSNEDMAAINKVNLDPVDPQEYGQAIVTCSHGTFVASLIGGPTVGLVPKANVVPVTIASEKLRERFLEALVRILDDLLKHPERGPKAVINMSWAVVAAAGSSRFRPTLMALMKLIKETKAIFVVSAGNHGTEPLYSDRNLPQVLALDSQFSDNMLIAGAMSKDGKHGDFSERFENDPDMNALVHAPGKDVRGAGEGPGKYPVLYGTSYAAPLVSGLVAYLRGLPSKYQKDLEEPAKVKQLILAMQRKLGGADDGVPFIWNGQVKEKSCLVDGFDLTLPNPDGGDDLQPCKDLAKFFGTDVCPIGGSGPAKRQEDGSCGGGSVGDLPVPKPITWGTGEPYPTCTDNCGELCNGYYCVPRPTGEPPVFTDTLTSTTTTTTSTTTTTDDPGPTSDPDSCIIITIGIIEKGSSDAEGTSSITVNDKEKCKGSVPMSRPFKEEDEYSFDCDDGYEITFSWMDNTGGSDSIRLTWKIPGDSGDRDQLLVTQKDKVDCTTDEGDGTCTRRLFEFQVQGGC